MILFNHNKQVNLDYDDRNSELIMTDVESGVEIRAVFTEEDLEELIIFIGGESRQSMVDTISGLEEDLQGYTAMKKRVDELEDELDTAQEENEHLQDRIDNLMERIAG